MAIIPFHLRQLFWALCLNPLRSYIPLFPYSSSSLMSSNLIRSSPYIIWRLKNSPVGIFFFAGGELANQPTSHSTGRPQWAVLCTEGIVGGPIFLGGGSTGRDRLTYKRKTNQTKSFTNSALFFFYLNPHIGSHTLKGRRRRWGSSRGSRAGRAVRSQHNPVKMMRPL